MLDVISYLKRWADKGGLFALGWAALLCVGYGAGVRPSELLRVQFCDAAVEERSYARVLRIHVPWRKTSHATSDLQADVLTVPPRGGAAASLDAASALDAYVRSWLGGTGVSRLGRHGDDGDTDPIFIQRMKTTGALVGAAPGKAITYAQALKEFRTLLTAAGRDGSAYALHSLRRGAVTRMVADGGIPERAITRLLGSKSGRADALDLRLRRDVGRRGCDGALGALTTSAPADGASVRLRPSLPRRRAG